MAPNVKVLIQVKIKELLLTKDAQANKKAFLVWGVTGAELITETKPPITVIGKMVIKAFLIASRYF